jgi:vitamin B12 transporter
VASWVRVDVAASYELSERVAVNGRLENLLDEGYECISGYNTEGRSRYVGLRASF